MMKMTFPFENDEGAEEYETMWVEQSGDHFVVMNSPFYARDVAYLDEVRGLEREDRLFFGGVTKPSGRSTVRVYVFEAYTIEAVMRVLNETGCSFEGSDSPGLYSMDVPTEASWPKVRVALEQLAAQGISDWEEGCVSQHHQSQEGPRG